MATLQHIADRIAHHAQSMPQYLHRTVTNVRERVPKKLPQLRVPSIRKPRLHIPRLRLPKSTTITCWFATGIVLAWAGFWNVFAVGHLFNADAGNALGPMLALSLPVTIVTFLAISAPKFGGLLLLPLAMLSSTYFSNTGLRLLFAGPAIFMGAALIYSGPWIRFKPRLPRRNKRKNNDQYDSPQHAPLSNATV
jgi:hypothetical protein